MSVSFFALVETAFELEDNVFEKRKTAKNKLF
jgi:hypothetical protein